MRPRISARHYHDADIYREELLKLFGRVWNFVGLTTDLERDEDYVVADLGGDSVVVQNFGGELRAFRNVCSHRFSRIRGDSCGNGPLRCPYHGWQYNKEGIPHIIPKRPRFDDLDQDTLESLRLESWSVETCGKFVFVRKGGDGPGLADYLGSAHTTLERVSEALGERIDQNEMVVRANWKITVENTLESYHVGFIHTETFQKLGLSGFNFGLDGPHTSWSAPLADKMDARMQKLNAVLASRPMHLPGYFHQLIFPNLTIATTYGTSFSIQLFRPLGPGETQFTSHVFATVLGTPPNDLTAQIAASLNQSVKEFNRAVFEEDRVICDQVQLGAQQTSKAGILSEEEKRVLAFQASYVQYME